jgi:ataxia telangiectasia mutated family protein
MRQDAVMQQVFRMVNVWLQHDGETKKRRLMVQTYRIVPLSPQAGVLEWCEDTVPLGHWLTQDGGGGAHARYRPQDMSAKRCREIMAAEAKSASNNEKLLDAYLGITEKFSPVLRFIIIYFFFKRKRGKKGKKRKKQKGKNKTKTHE